MAAYSTLQLLDVAQNLLVLGRVGRKVPAGASVRSLRSGRATRPLITFCATRPLAALRPRRTGRPLLPLLPALAHLSVQVLDVALLPVVLVPQFVDRAPQRR